MLIKILVPQKNNFLLSHGCHAIATFLRILNIACNPLSFSLPVLQFQLAKGCGNVCFENTAEF